MTSEPEPELPAPRFANGIDTAPLLPKLETLIKNDWILVDSGASILKTYFFRKYFSAVSFVNVVAAQSASKSHHPTIKLRLGSVEIHWTSHHPPGLTGKDVDMAELCDEAAELMGAVEKGKPQKCGPATANLTPEEAQSSKVRYIVD
ncbi:transcriptional coactivator/pterin dehydratase [Aspergillus steynii IBT 23096]|uniref:4a-hydroxytetrahydrobiopterin dehydratase n=1 Tax=Aspergillus steynii IBT 23096 TaxID=1392250 RepID=A0A2I2G4F6_9EURO|nr:transcriptional coactivator/pterin dehydratase [Aspergillus steynii IBT 23096]PLB47765.1 transcriptional coactivator/pterin dehydratase [Aspergillus steynii IBT 23096]